MRINRFFLLAGFLAFLFSACGEENPAVFPIDSIASEATSSSIQNAGISSSSLATSTLSSSEQTESSSQTTLSSSLTVALSSSSVDATSSSSNLSSSGFGPVSFGEITDERDGHVYKTVKIGNQWWMAENLNYAYTKPIKNELVDMDSSSICYNNEPDSCAKYGRLYMWEAAMDYSNDESCSDYDELLTTRGVCPEKWHIPSIEEWFTLLNIVNDLAAILKSTSGWLDDGNGSDTFGFNVLPAGTGNSNIGKRACYWTPAQYTRQLDEFAPISYCERAQCFCFYSNNEIITYEDNMKKYAYSVRCVMDSTATE